MEQEKAWVPGHEMGPALNSHEERACRLLSHALGVREDLLRCAVHEIVLAGRGAVDVRGLDRAISKRIREEGKHG